MTPRHLLFLFCLTYLGVFLPAWASSFGQVLGVQPVVLPALMVLSGLKGSIPALAMVAILGGLWHDALSANPLGASILPLFLAGALVHLKRDLILHDQAYAQFVLGAAAGAAVPLLTLILLHAVGEMPMISWASLWQWSFLSLSAALLTPVLFWLFQQLDRLFAPQPQPEPAFRPDRQLKRGRFYK
jgi:cell shape-determining protein MreD